MSTLRGGDVTVRREFAGGAWLELMKNALSDAFERASPEERSVSFSYAETYVNPPKHLARREGTGYTARFDEGEMVFLDHPSDDVDVHIIATYDAILPRIRMIIADDPEAFWAAREPLLRAGALRVEANNAQLPAFLADVHDVVARLTL